MKGNGTKMHNNNIIEHTIEKLMDYDVNVYINC